VIALRLGRFLVACGPLLALGCAFAAKQHLGAVCVFGCAGGAVVAPLAGLMFCALGGGSMGDRAAEPYEQLLPSLADLPCGGCGQCDRCDLRGADA
jgi:hypothetical protein